MKRYTCPHCKSQYHVEPNACPICCWSVGEDGPMEDIEKFSITREQVATLNGLIYKLAVGRNDSTYMGLGIEAQNILLAITGEAA
jgi:hypothetical protein